MIGIAAIAFNGVIGNGGKLPWNVPGDLKWFKEITNNSILLVGRNTFNTLPPLKNREIWVLTKNPIANNEIKTPEDLVNKHNKQVFLAGGSMIYSSYMHLCDAFYVTHIDGEFNGDAYFDDKFFSMFKEIALIREGDGFVVKSYSRIT